MSSTEILDVIVHVDPKVHTIWGYLKAKCMYNNKHFIGVGPLTYLHSGVLLGIIGFRAFRVYGCIGLAFIRV